MSKKSKCATALLATALLSYGFTLDTEQEIKTAEPETQREVAVEKESTPITEPQHLVSEEEIQVEILVEEVKETEVEIVATETESPQTLEPQQATAPVQIQADTGELVPMVPKAQEVTATREPTINIPDPDSMNGIDYGTEQSIQPDVDPRPTYTEEQLTDPTQTPDGTPVEVYVPEESFPEKQTSTDLAYVPGFGWVPLPEPSEVIFAEDMYMNGNKVGTMGGG